MNWQHFTSSSPAYGCSVLVSINGITQSITYCRDGSDDSRDWLEPYGEHIDEDLKGELSFFIDFESDIKFAYISEIK